MPPAWPPLAPPVPPVFVGPPAIATPPAGPTIDPDVTNFMAAQFAALTNPANNPPGAAPLTWTFSKLLGAGTFGVVGCKCSIFVLNDKKCPSELTNAM